jgi:hypothetical protein
MGFARPSAICLLVVATLSSWRQPNLPQDDQIANYSSVSFDASVFSLPRRFAGSDPKAVFEGLLALQRKAAKGEFESTEEYQLRRLREFAKNPVLTGALAIDSIYAFRLKDLTAKYDADARLLTVTVPIHGVRIGNQMINNAEKPRRALEVERIVVGSRQYEASNAFGAKVLVESYSEDAYEVALSGLQIPYGFDDFSFTMRLTPQDATKIKPHLAGLIVLKLDPPWPYYTAEDVSHSPATFDLPYENSTHYRYILGKGIDLWLFNEVDGQVLAKLSTTPNSASQTATQEVMRQLTQVLEKERAMIDAYESLLKANPKHTSRTISFETCSSISTLSKQLDALTSLMKKYNQVELPATARDSLIESNGRLGKAYDQLKSANYHCPSQGW